MRSIGMEFGVIKTGYPNLIQSGVFKKVFFNTYNVDLIYNIDGSQGAAGVESTPGIIRPRTKPLKG